MPAEPTQHLDTVHDLQSNEQSELLDAIDKLRQEHVDTEDLDIPQIVVCGDQSSGKSSVLEAIAQIHFPVGIDAVTKFPIEVVLRNAAESKIDVQLHASLERDASTREQIERFKSAVQKTDQFPAAVKEAKAHLDAIDKNGKFWRDWLRVEVSGPTQPHLTLVDLPGLIHFEGKVGGHTNTAMIKEVSKSYLENEQTVVLAVIGATNDPASQEILSLINEAKSAKQRAMGIITKPDRLQKGSDEERRIVRLARNESIEFGLGWHIVKNISHDDDEHDRKDRDALERAFFSSGVWSGLDPRNLGISHLRKKLSKSLFGRIQQGLPQFLDSMEKTRTSCSTELLRLGVARSDTPQQREYLAKVLSQLQRLIEAALSGHYGGKSEFQAFFDADNDNRALRDVIRKESKRFAYELKKNGKQYLIYDDESEKQHIDFKGFEELTEHEPLFVQPYVSPGTLPEPHLIQLKEYCRALALHVDSRTGISMTGRSEQAVQDIFRQQSVYWKSITSKHVDQCFSATFEFMESAVKQVADEHMVDKLMQHYIKPAFDMKDIVLAAKVDDLLWPYQESHPMTYNSTFRYRLGRENGELFREKVKAYDERDDLAIAAEHLDEAEIYYEIAANTFIDNVATLAIERWLLNDLRSLTPPEKVWTLSDELVGKLAAETDDIQARRKRLIAQVDALRNAANVCKRHVRSKGRNGKARDEDLSRSVHRASERTQATEVPRVDSLPMYSSTRSEAGQSIFGKPATNGFGASRPGIPPASTGPLPKSTVSVCGANSAFGGAARAETGSSSDGPSLFGNSNGEAVAARNNTSGGFAGFGTSPNTSGIFGNGSAFRTNNVSGLDAESPQPRPSSGTGLFGMNKNTSDTSTGLFGGSDSNSKTGASSRKQRGSGGWLFSPFVENNKEPFMPNQPWHYQSISATPQFRDCSVEELRLEDYTEGRRLA